MKHQHTVDINVKVDIPTKELKSLIDKASGPALIILGSLMFSRVVKAKSQPEKIYIYRN